MKYFFIIVLLLSSCGLMNQSDINNSQNNNNVKPIPEPMPVAVSPPAPPPPVIVTTIKSAPAILLTREYLYPNEKVYSKNINFIFLPHKPITASEIKQYNLVCEIWKTSLVKNKDALEDIKESDNIITMPIYWPLKNNIKSEECSELINNYDYTGMQVVGINYNVDATKLMLVCRMNNVSIVMYLSSIKSEDDLLMAFNTWRSKICKPAVNESKVYAYTVLISAKKVLGALAGLITMKT